MKLQFLYNWKYWEKYHITKVYMNQYIISIKCKEVKAILYWKVKWSYIAENPQIMLLFQRLSCFFGGVGVRSKEIYHSFMSPCVFIISILVFLKDSFPCYSRIMCFSKYYFIYISNLSPVVYLLSYNYSKFSVD